MQSICRVKYMLWPTVHHTLVLYQKDQMDLAGFWHSGYTRRILRTVIRRFSHLHLQSTSTISATLSKLWNVLIFGFLTTACIVQCCQLSLTIASLWHRAITSGYNTSTMTWCITKSIYDNWALFCTTAERQTNCRCVFLWSNVALDQPDQQGCSRNQSLTHVTWFTKW